MDLSQAAIHPLVTGRGHVGTSDIHFGDAHIDKIYTGFINNGYDIGVPVTNSADSFALESEITDINSKIPAQASSSNQLADKNFVNSSIATNTANFIGTFNSVADLEAYSGTVTNNDYAFVIGTDGDGNTVYNRYKYTTATTPASWVFEYALNNSSFTANQWASINSGVTSSDVTLARSAVQPGDVGNGTITLTQGGTTKGTFTTNQSGNTTIDLDAGGAGGYHPDLFDWKWADSLRNDVQWLRADTFSWQSGSVYQAAFDELFYDIQISTYWYSSGGPAYTKSRTPAVGDAVYLNSDLTTQIGTVDSYDNVNDEITVSGNTYSYMSNTYVTPTTETVAGYSLSVYTGHSGRKIVSVSDETNVANIYTATGVAWYYIIDIPNKRFKLPRTKFGVTGLRDTVGNYVAPGLPNITGKFAADAGQGGFDASGAFYTTTGTNTGRSWDMTASTNYAMDASRSSSVYGNSTTVQPPATQMYLYFYVGEFTQEAIENTAGLNAEDFNDKADTDFGNTNMIDYVVAKQDPNAGNGYTWYRKYASGLVEQGGHGTTTLTVTLPVPMADTNYDITTGNDYYSASGGTPVAVYYDKTTTGFKLQGRWNGSGTSGMGACWRVSGMAA